MWCRAQPWERRVIRCDLHEWDDSQLCFFIMIQALNSIDTSILIYCLITTCLVSEIDWPSITHCGALSWAQQPTTSIKDKFQQTPRIGFLLDSKDAKRHTLRVVAMVTGLQDDIEAEKMTVEQMIAMKAGKSFSRYTKVEVELIQSNLRSDIYRYLMYVGSVCFFWFHWITLNHTW